MANTPQDRSARDRSGNPLKAVILLVDDEPSIRRITRGILENEGYSVVEAASGKEALQHFELSNPDLVLLDVLMPGMNGFETCAQLQLLPRGQTTPVLMITALDDPESIEKAFQSGAMDFITKPVQWVVLRQRVRRLLEMKRAQELIEQQRIDAELKYRVTFEKLITTISAHFITINPSEIDEAINFALQRIGEFADVDRSYVFLFHENGLFMDNSHEWCAPGIEPHKPALQAIPTMLFPWWMEKFNALENVYIPNMSELPREAKVERKFLEARQAKSIIAVPMVYHNQLSGFLGFDAVRAEKVWSDDIIALMKIVGEIFISTIQHKRTEEALQKSERQLRQITDTMLDTVYQTDGEGIIRFASPSCLQVLGYLPDQLIGLSIYTYVHPDDLAEMKRSLKNVGMAEYRYLHAQGHYLWLETLSNLIFSEDGSIEGIVFASRDITGRKNVEKELQELNRMKTEFLSTAAHELRTPLTSIRGFSEILITRQLAQDRQHRYLKMINEQATYLGRIIDDLLDISRLEAKQHLTLMLEPIDLAALVRATVVPLAEAATKHTLRVTGASTMPPIQGDRIRLAQVIQNLVSNAIKYSPQGGEVTVDLLLADGKIEVSVTDQGIGMTPEQQTHLFEKFYRADASNTAISGTGLGLAISKLIVELHGGKIWAKSEYGSGSTFAFSLPVPDLSLAEAQPGANEVNDEEDIDR